MIKRLFIISINNNNNSLCLGFEFKLCLTHRNLLVFFQVMFQIIIECGRPVFSMIRENENKKAAGGISFPFRDEGDSIRFDSKLSSIYQYCQLLIITSFNSIRFDQLYVYYIISLDLI